MRKQNNALPDSLHSIEDERAVLGSLLVDSDAIVRVATILGPLDFWRDPHKWIYTAILRLHEQGTAIDFLTVFDYLDAQGYADKVGGPAYLTGLIDAMPTSVHVEHYARNVRDLSRRRNLLDLAGRIAELAVSKNKPLDEVLAQLDTVYYEATSRVSTTDVMSMKQLMGDLYDEVEYAMQRQGLIGVTTGIEDLDELLGGLHKSDLIYMAARPAVGKTATMLNIALSAAKAGKQVLLVSLEMSAIQVAQRLACIETGLNTKKLRRGQFGDGEFLRLMDGMSRLGNLPLHVIWSGNQDPLALRSTARKHAAEYGLDLLCIDYLQLMTAAETRGRNRREQVDDISRSLKLLAKDLDVPVMANAQLSRGLETRTDKRPVLSDLRESGALEQDADIVLFLYRAEMYDSDDPGLEGKMEAIVGKHRNGPTGTVFLHMRPWSNQVVGTRIVQEEAGLQIRMPLDEMDET